MKPVGLNVKNVLKVMMKTHMFIREATEKFKILKSLTGPPVK